MPTPKHRIRFVRATPVAASAADLFAWHEAPGAFERLTPPSEPVRVLRHEGGIRDGARVSLSVGYWPLAFRWELEHRDYQYGRAFTDVQRSGPFRSWTHVHRMVPDGPNASVLEDSIEFELPLGALGRRLGETFMKRKLERLFAYRHAVTRRAFAQP